MDCLFQCFLGTTTMIARFLPGCYLFGIALFLSICANWSSSLSQSDLPPLPDRQSPNPRGLLDPQRAQAYPPSDLQNSGAIYQGAGVHVVGPSTSSATATHLMSTATLSTGFQQLVIVDPATLTLAVYHIEPSRGDIQLKSVRKIDADFSLEEFSLSEPTPSTIRRTSRSPSVR